VRSPEAALHALSLATDGGRDPGLVMACLDRTRRPLTMFVVDGGRAEDLPVAVDILLDAVPAASPLDAVVLALCRPGRSAEPDPADAEAWPRLRGRCRQAGVALLDWFILADGAAVSVPERLGDTTGW
jgi:DNA repair protein RadC